MIYRNKITGETREVGGTTTSDITSTNGVDFQSLLLQAALADPKNASKYSSIASLIPKESADAQKKKLQQANAERVVKQLEDQYLFNQREPLAYGRLEGIKQTYLMNVAKGENPELRTYLTTRDRNKPFLARAAGDVGNLSAPEQERAVAQLPTAMSTPEEALQGFNAVRQSLGLPVRDLTTELQTKKPEFMAKLSQEQQPSSMVSGGQTSGGQTSGGTPVDQREFWQRLLNTGEQKVNVPLPNLPYQGIGTAAGGFVKNPLVAAGLGGVGNWLDQLKAKGIPLTQQMAEQWKGNSTAEAVKAAATSGGLNLALHPLQTLGNIRNAALAGKEFSGNVITEAGKEFLKSVGTKPQYLKTGTKLLTEDVTKFGGKKLTSQELLEALAGRGKDTYKASQDIASNAAAKYNSKIWEALRKELANTSTVADISTNLMSTLYKLGNMGKSLGKILTYGALGAGAAAGTGYVVGKATGGQ